ncbi:MAG: DUF5686 family protein [Methanococcaceae archaeon]
MTINIYGQAFRVNGFVYDKETNHALAHATILVKGQTIGTTANSEGLFFLDFPPGQHEIQVSFIGYITESYKIKVPYKGSLKVGLIPYTILLPEVVIGSNQEDPAYRIIREVISHKEINRKGLNSLMSDGYKKTILKSAGQIAQIEESLYNRFEAPGKESEFILAAFKSQNMKVKTNEAMNNIKLKKIDFNGESADIFGSKVYLPLSKNTFDYYDFKLLNTKTSEKTSIYTIEVIPKSSIRPLLKGILYIEDKSFALAGLEFSNNEGVTIPFVTDLNIGYTQKMVKTENYWLLQFSQSVLSAGFNFGGLLTLDKIELQQTYNNSSYRINAVLPDSFFSVKQLVSGRSILSVGKEIPDSIYFKKFHKNGDTVNIPAELTQNEIDSLRPIPLNELEVTAYALLDSTKKITDFVKPKGALSSLIKTQETRQESGFFMKAAESLVELIDFNNNRVSGVGLGLRYKYDLKNSFNTVINAKYSFGHKKVEGSVLNSILLNKKGDDIIKFNVFDQTRRWEENTQFGELVNSISVTVGLEDNYNYLHSTGYLLGYRKNWSDSIYTQINFISDKISSLTKLNNQRIFSSRYARRSNPVISEGTDNKIEINFVEGTDPFVYQVFPASGFSFQSDISHKAFQSDFNYLRLHAALQLKFKTIFQELFFSPYLLARIESGFINGTHGLQHLFTPEGAPLYMSAFGVFRCIQSFEYSGSKILALHLEHNWYGIVFQSLGLKSLKEMNLSLLTGTSFLKMWGRTNIENTASPASYYWEAYTGISGIFGLLRLDFVYSSERKTALRFGLAIGGI